MSSNKNILMGIALFFLIILIIAVFSLRNNAQSDIVTPTSQEAEVLEDDDAIREEIDELERRLEEAIRMLDPELIEK